MKKYLILASLAFIGVLAFAQCDFLTVLPGGVTRVYEAGRVAHVEVLSSVSNGTAAVKRVRELVALRDDVTTTYSTNVTYTLSYSNGTEIVTNTVDVDYSPFAAGMRYISYATNTTVTATSVTNVVPYVATCVTNDLCESITCTGGVGSAALTNKFVFPGDKIFFTGTAKGKVEIIVED